MLTTNEDVSIFWTEPSAARARRLQARERQSCETCICFVNFQNRIRAQTPSRLKKTVIFMWRVLQNRIRAQTPSRLKKNAIFCGFCKSHSGSDAFTADEKIQFSASSAKSHSSSDAFRAEEKLKLLLPCLREMRVVSESWTFRPKDMLEGIYQIMKDTGM